MGSTQTTESMTSDRIGKPEFLDICYQRYGKDAGLTKQQLRSSYDIILKSLTDLVMDGKKVVFVGFGTFYLQTHKGQPVQFGHGGACLNDYFVLKFSASTTINKQIRHTQKHQYPDMHIGNSSLFTGTLQKKTKVMRAHV